MRGVWEDEPRGPQPHMRLFHVVPSPRVCGTQDAAGAPGISGFWGTDAQGDRFCCRPDALLLVLPESSALLTEKIISGQMYGVDMFCKQGGFCLSYFLDLV